MTCAYLTFNLRSALTDPIAYLRGSGDPTLMKLPEQAGAIRFLGSDDYAHGPFSPCSSCRQQARPLASQDNSTLDMVLAPGAPERETR